jgi:polysaccharide pyruvyl transferase CsaB
MGKAEKKENNRRGVLICGAYGYGNAGDDAILEAIVKEMRGIDPDIPITVMSRTPKETERKYKVKSIFTFDFPEFLNEMRKSRLYINGGGSLIQDVTSRRSLWFYLFTIRAAKLLGCRVIMYGCGIGPVTRARGKRSVRNILNKYVDVITLRENHSRAELESYGVTRPEIILSSDPAMILEPAPEEEVSEVMKSNGLDPKGRYICLCLRRWPGFREKSEFFAAAADYAIEKYGLQPIFLSIDHQNDGDAADAVLSMMKGRGKVLRNPMGTARTIGILSRMEIVLSMRLHGLIFASAQGAPLVGVSYDPKVTAFLDYIGQELYLEFDSLSKGQLEPLIDEAVKLGAQREKLREKADALRAVEGRNIEAARKLLL